jgi:hypothetical protein
VFTQLPFAEVDTEEISATVSTMFNTNVSDQEEEILKLQCDIPLKASAPDSILWNLLNEEQYPDLKSVALHWTEFSVSTYLCKEVFSQKMIPKPFDQQTFKILPSLVPK